MLEEQLKAFLEKVKGDSNLQDKLKAAKHLKMLWALLKNTVMNSPLIRSISSVKRSWKAWLVELTVNKVGRWKLSTAEGSQ